ncbi:MAG: RNA methyltransferase substrate-binding domain-containing protein, partial [Ilumatobacteraceae bacterium]
MGGEQVEGRQAVREVLIASRRRVRELLIADESERNPVIGEIIDLAKSQRVQIRDVSRKEIDERSRSEAPQGVIAFV